MLLFFLRLFQLTVLREQYYFTLIINILVQLDLLQHFDTEVKLAFCIQDPIQYCTCISTTYFNKGYVYKKKKPIHSLNYTFFK